MHSVILASALAAVALAAPAKRQSTDIDATILNYALTLEHLEAAFYQEGITKYTEEDFKAVGLDNVFWTNLNTIAGDEKTHVEFLTTALQAAGATPVVANEYDFGLTDATSFLATAAVLEGVGVSAYLGAASLITSKDYLTYAGSILTVEARHSAYLHDSQRPQQKSPFPAPFDTPASINEVYTMAAPFITKDNNPNANLPVKAFPSLTYAGGEAPAGSDIEVTTKDAVNAVEAYFLAITGPVKADYTANGNTYTVTIPATLAAGQSYLLLTSGGAPTDENTVAGPAIVYVADAQYGIKRETICDEAGNAPSYGSGSGSGSGSAPSYGSGSSSSGSHSGSSSAPSYGSGSSTSGSSAPSYRPSQA